MAKLSLSDVTNFQNEQSAASIINTNSDRVEAAIENTLSRDGTTPNMMGADIDMNSHRVYNLPFPQASTDPLRYGDVSDILTTYSNNLSVPATGAIEAILDGNGFTLLAGRKLMLEIPYTCYITKWVMVGDVSGSCVIDLWKSAYPTVPTIANTIVASAPPTLSSAQVNQDSTLTGWVTTLTAGDILTFNITSATTIQRVVLSLRVTRT